MSKMNSERWMKVAADMFSHPKFRSFCRKAGLDEDAGFAKLCRFWAWVQKIYPDGVVTDASPDDIALAMGYGGDAQTLMDALLHCGRRSGFLERTESGELVCHQWFDYGGMLFERRFRDRQRKQSGRGTSKDGAGSCEESLTKADDTKASKGRPAPARAASGRGSAGASAAVGAVVSGGRAVGVSGREAAAVPAAGAEASGLESAVVSAAVPSDASGRESDVGSAAGDGPDGGGGRSAGPSPDGAAMLPSGASERAAGNSAPSVGISAEFRANGSEIRAYTTQQNTTQNNTENPLPPSPPASRGDAGASPGKGSRARDEARKRYSAEFDALWQEYPRKLGKEQARKSYLRHRASGVSFEEIRDGLRRYVAYLRRRGTELRYCLNGATFFGPNCRWRDEEYGSGSLLFGQGFTPPPEEEQRAADRDFGGDLLACRKWNRLCAR